MTGVGGVGPQSRSRAVVRAERQERQIAHLREGASGLKRSWLSTLPCALMLLVALPAASVGAAEFDAAHAIGAMTEAVHSLDYQGSFVYEHDGRIDALRIFHAAGIGARERERLVRMSGPRCEIVREGASITILQSGAPTVILANRVGARLLPLVPDAPASALASSYQVSLAGEDRVAGYPARIVDIAPRDGYRHGYRLWLADASHLLLRSQVRDAANHTLEQFMFVALEIGAKPRESDLASSGDAGITTTPQEQPLDGNPQWHVTDAPPGFVFLRAQRPAQGPSNAEHQLYTDGLASVSVYIEPGAGAATVVDRATMRGALSIYTHTDGGWKFTALGDVPRVTVERMARSVKFATAAVAR